MKVKPLNSIYGAMIVIALCLSYVQGFAQNTKEMVIVTFGNSTTAPRATIKKVYAVRLHELLTTAGIPNHVINSGVGSSHTGSIKDNDFAKVEHAMDRFEKSVLSHQPDLVTINFGLNDAWQDDGVNGKSRIPIQDYRRNLSYFIDQIKEQGGKVILLPPNPIGAKFERSRYELVKKYMKTAQKLAKEKNVPFLNTWKLFYKDVKGNPKGIDALMLDGIHPGDRGHELIADALSEMIIQTYQSTK